MTHKYPQVQLVAMHRTPQESHRVPESIVQIPVELCQAQRCDTSLQELSCAQPGSG